MTKYTDDPGANDPNYDYIDAYDEGEEAYHEGYKKEENPHTENTDAYRGWEDGWLNEQYDAQHEFDSLVIEDLKEKQKKWNSEQLARLATEHATGSFGPAGEPEASWYWVFEPEDLEIFVNAVLEEINGSTV